MLLGYFGSALSSFFLIFVVECMLLLFVNYCYCLFWIYKKCWSFCIFGFVKERRVFSWVFGFTLELIEV